MFFQYGLTKEELTKAYRQLAKQYHPDVCGDPRANEIMAQINEEYDNYFVQIQKAEVGLDWDDLFRRYAEQTRFRTVAFLRFNKRCNDTWFWAKNRRWGKWFFTREVTVRDIFPRLRSVIWTSYSNSDSFWNSFRGGFQMVELENDTDEAKFKPVDCVISCPTKLDMCFAMIGKSASKELIVDKQDAVSSACLSEREIYKHVSSKRYGDFWVRTTYNKKVATAYVKANGIVCSTDIPLVILQDANVIETCFGYDFGFAAFQDCTRDEFHRTHDVNYRPTYSEALNCRLLNKDEFYWIDDPVVAHFARTGLLQFYCAGTNFRMRYGTFNAYELDRKLYELTIEDAEHIQDFLDDLNEEFDNYIKRLIKKGTLRIAI